MNRNHAFKVQQRLGSEQFRAQLGLAYELEQGARMEETISVTTVLQTVVTA
jgi:hypothetical protein